MRPPTGSDGRYLVCCSRQVDCSMENPCASRVVSWAALGMPGQLCRDGWLTFAKGKRALEPVYSGQSWQPKKQLTRVERYISMLSGWRASTVCCRRRHTPRSFNVRPHVHTTCGPIFACLFAFRGDDDGQANRHIGSIGRSGGMRRRTAVR
jgi:hypothetical protein